MNENDNKLNLPAIRKTGTIAKPFATKTVSKLDLDKKTSISNIMKAEFTSVQKEILKLGQGLDLVLVGDLTTSMTAYHQLLKDKFKKLCVELFKLIENLKIGIIFYLDHDAYLPYCTTVAKLTNNSESLFQFITETPVLHSGNSTDDEAAEDALFYVSNLNWREMGNRSVILFGDARAHESSDCPLHRSYFELVKRMYQSNITINSVFCGREHQGSESLQQLKNVNVGDFNTKIAYPSNSEFFSWIANVTGGMVIGVDKIDDLLDIILAAAAKDSGHLDDLEEKMKKTSLNKLKLIEIAKKSGAPKKN
jgi:hypothetical protein